MAGKKCFIRSFLQLFFWGNIGLKAKPPPFSAFKKLPATYLVDYHTIFKLSQNIVDVHNLFVNDICFNQIHRARLCLKYLWSVNLSLFSYSLENHYHAWLCWELEMEGQRLCTHLACPAAPVPGEFHQLQEKYCWAAGGARWPSDWLCSLCEEWISSGSCSL